jgi:hypothetical protein
MAVWSVSPTTTDRSHDQFPWDAQTDERQVLLSMASEVFVLGVALLRYDLVDKGGRMTLRRAGRLHHLGIGAAHRGRRVLAIVDEREVTVVAADTGEVLSARRIAPARDYWRNRQRDPGRWPGSQAPR